MTPIEASLWRVSDTLLWWVESVWQTPDVMEGDCSYDPTLQYGVK